MSLYNKGSIISSNLIYRPNQGSQVRVLSSRPKRIKLCMNNIVGFDDYNKIKAAFDEAK